MWIVWCCYRWCWLRWVQWLSHSNSPFEDRLTSVQHQASLYKRVHTINDMFQIGCLIWFYTVSLKNECNQKEQQAHCW
jgi:hypothetical protein